MDRFVDTHAHLDDPRFRADLDSVVKRAADAGVEDIITVGCWSHKSGFAPVLDTVRRYGKLYFALGVHPHEAREVQGSRPWDDIRAALSSPLGGRLVAIGEAGLDYHYDNSPRERQKEVFRAQVRLARELNLPVIVHSREADADTLEILKDEGAALSGGVFHCFSGTVATARAALELGFYLSFTGVVTFPKADALREAVKAVPIEKMLIETDCPYLAPAPHRGERNEPSYVVGTASEIARLKGLTLSDVARITTLNARELFGLEGPSGGEKPKIAYQIRDSLYLNITNRCSNYCTFCAKFSSYTVKGHYLRLRQEPSFAEVVSAIGPDPEEKYSEIVFCGFGEPLIRLDVVKEVGMYLKRKGCRIRIDTDGLANLVHGRNVLPELKFVDCVSVSLNAPDSATYQRLIRTPFGDNAYPAVLFFLKEAKKHIPKVIASVVAVPGLDVEACRKVAEDELGVGFRVREYNTVG